MGKRFIKNLKYIKDCIMTFIYDDECKCVLCGTDIDDGNLCLTCKKKLKKNKENPIMISKNVYAYSGIYYNFEAKNLLINFKYSKDFQCGKVIADIMIECIKEYNIEFDYIIPVPIKSESYKKREFNQSLFLAKTIGDYFDKKVLNVLFFNRKIQNQKTLSKYDREKNIKEALSSKPNSYNKLRNKKILIVDDVITTGSTLKECIRVIGKDKNIDIKVLTGIKSSI